MRRRITPTLLVAIALAAPLGAQTTDALYRSWELDVEASSARSAALGGAVAAAADDAMSAALYPASLSLVSETDIRLAVRYSGSGSIGTDRVQDRWTLAGGALARPLGQRSGFAVYYHAPRALDLELGDTPLPDGSTDSGRLEAVVRDTGVAFGTALTPRLRVGVRLGAARLDLDGQASTHSPDGSEAGMAASADAWEPSAGIGLLFAADHRFHTSLYYDHQRRWSVGRTSDSGVEETHELVAPARLTGGLLFRPSSVIWITGQLDWVRSSQVQAALVSPATRPPVSEFALDDRVDGRLGLEMRAEYGESLIWNRAVLRLGLHFRSRGLLEYVGDDPVEQARFPGAKRSTEWSVGAAFGPVEVTWISRKPSNVWVIGVRHFF